LHRSRILIADDHNLVADLCKNLLEAEFDVVGTVSDGHALVTAASELKPDVIIVDIAMPVLNGLDAAQRVKEMFPAVNVIFLTMNNDAEVAAEAFRRGAFVMLLMPPPDCYHISVSPRKSHAPVGSLDYIATHLSVVTRGKEKPVSSTGPDLILLCNS